MKQIILTSIAVSLFVGAIAQSIPSPKAYLGYEPGERFAQHHEIVGYMQALAAAAPAQMKVERYGTTNENRPLMLAYLSSAENMRRLDEIRKSNLALTGMGGTPLADAPAIVWLSYNVHGNEASSSQAVLVTAHHLLTNAGAQEWLKNTVVIIDPCLNPDGYSRYANWFHSVVGDQMNPDPASREHLEPWPGGRSNHYNFDLNRDWAWQTQVETQARIKKYNEWLPHIHVDFHEQGYNEPYYFAPAAEPFHEVITPWQRKFQTDIGRNHAKYFDKNGWLFFTRERFDLFYPSYGDTWPTYNGGIGMTYEQGGHSRGGLGIINEDGDTLTLADRLIHHHTTGISTIEITSLNANEVVKNFRNFFDNVNSNGSGEYKTYVVKAANSPNMPFLKQLLDRNGIKYTYAEAGGATGFSYNSGKTDKFNLERGDLLVSTVQPKGALARVLFEPNPKLSDSATYDITAWSVPYAYGLNAFAVKEKLTGTPGLAVAAGPLPVPDENAYGYVVAWNHMDHARFLADCLKKGIKPRMAELPFETNGKKYERGTLIFVKTSNQGVKDLYKTLFELAGRHQVTLERVQTGFMDKGADFGSPDVKTLRPVKVAMLTGDGVSSLSAGQVWHYFDRDLGYPITLINARDAGSADLRRFDVLILPAGFAYGGLLGKEGALKKWVEQGGFLIAMDNVVGQLAGNEWGLKERVPPESKPGTYDLLKTYGNRERDALMDNNPGSIYKLELDNTHPLAFGYPKQYFTLKGDTKVYDFTDRGWTVGVMKKEAQVAGFTGSKALEQMKDGVVFGELPIGRGAAIFLADDILFRNFWQNGKLMMANAVFFIGQGRGFRL
ncbi:MAG TPA: M14 family metallopeptidase [Phnomibacter sp.]|nr:M14 family metallopeptidase [Phnomibacter sp.]